MHCSCKPVATCMYEAFSTQVIKKYSRLHPTTAPRMKLLSFTRSSQAGLTTVMVYCTVLLSIKLRNLKES